jgi:hypothetical protein
VTAPSLQIRIPEADEITLIPKGGALLLTLGLLAKSIEVAIFPDTEGVGVGVGDALGDGETVGEALATEELVAVEVDVFVETFVDPELV